MTRMPEAAGSPRFLASLARGFRWVPGLLTGAIGILFSAMAAAQAAQESPPETPADAAPPNPVLPKVEGLLQGDPTKASTWKSLLDSLSEQLVAFVPNLIYALVVLAAFFVFHLVLSRVMRSVLRRSRSDPALAEILSRLTKYVLAGFATLMATAQLGFDIASLIAGVGVIGLAIGLASQDTLANLVAGLTILWDRPFATGDYVTIAGTYGRVDEVGLRSTRMRTPDERDIVLPNRDVINQKIANHTKDSELRIDVPVGIAYHEDIREARKVLLAAVVGNEFIDPTRPPQVVAKGLGDSSVNLELRVYLADPRLERPALFHLVEVAKIALDEAGIEIPFPQRTLHLADGSASRAVAEWRQERGRADDSLSAKE